MGLKSSLIYLFMILVLSLTASLTACGGGDGGGGGENSNNLNGWVEIDYYSVQQDDPDLGTYAYISGTAFVSPNFVAHKCVGMGCILGWFDDSYPGVNVTWWNRADDSTGNASSRYGTLTNWNNEWYAAVPLVYGPNMNTNLIVITATDGDGVTGASAITIPLTQFP